MIKLESYHSNLVTKLKSIYPEKEAESIAKYFICELLGISNTGYHLQKRENLSEVDLKALCQGEKRLLKSEPVQYVVGHAYLYGNKFSVNKNVLIPRQETEILIHTIIERNKHRSNLNIIDIGTGTGCIIISVAKEFQNFSEHKKKFSDTESSTASLQTTNSFYGIDFDSNAVATAEKNAKINNVQINFDVYDIFSEDKFPFNRDFNIIISNPPYITESEKKEILANVKDYEPESALFVPDDNPLLYYKKIIEFAENHGSKGKCDVYFEINEKYGIALEKYCRSKNIKHFEIIKDLNNKDRVVVLQINNP